MPKGAESPHAYFAGCREGNRETLCRLFTKAHEALPAHEISMRYGFPLLDGHGKFGVAERSDGIAVYIHHDKLSNAVERAGPSLGPFRLAKESLRYRKATDIPVDTVVALARELFAL